MSFLLQTGNMFCNIRSRSLNGIFGAAPICRQDMNLCSKNRIQKQIRPNVGGVRIHMRSQIQNRCHSTFSHGCGGFHCMVGLGCTVGKHCITAFIFCIIQKVFQLADLVSSKERHAGKIFPLRIKIDFIFIRNAVQTLKGRGIKSQIDFTNSLQKHFCIFYTIHTRILLIFYSWLLNNRSQRMNLNCTVVMKALVFAHFAV